jgi:signal transduction histidine kinase
MAKFSDRSDQKNGQGLGTYSMKLLDEQLLGGRVTFSSSSADGTCFRLHLSLALVS